MTTGKDLAETLVQFGQLLAGTGFTVYCNLDHHPDIRGSRALDEVVKRQAGEIIQQRMAKSRQLATELVQLCSQSGVFWVHPERGKAIHLDQQLTPEEEAALKALQNELHSIETFIQI